MEGRHKETARDHEHSVQMFSQKVLSMRDRTGPEPAELHDLHETDRGPMPRAKMNDLHSAVQNKNTENEILNAQIALKNGEITHLLDEIDRVREINREKMKKFET